MKIFSYISVLRKLFICCTVSMCLTAQASYALEGGEQARDFIQNIGSKVIDIVSNNKILDDKKEHQLDTLFIETVDINWIAKFVAGRYWRESTTEQQAKYLKLYNSFLVRSYVSKFRQYTDQKMVVNKFITEAEGEYLIETRIDDPEGKSYNVSYKVKKLENGQFKIYDIIAEGVSMITTQRSEFGSVLSREGMDALIAKLEKKS